jgi:hypothetical protein
MMGCLGTLAFFGLPIFIAWRDAPMWWLVPSALGVAILFLLARFSVTYNVISRDRDARGRTAIRLILYNTVLYGLLMLLVYAATRLAMTFI